MKNIIHHDILKHNDKFIGLTYKYFDVEDNLDLDKAQKILDEDHYGLEKIKNLPITQVVEKVQRFQR